jgi:hypothetical protein
MHLKPLQQWVCDTCHEIIERPEDGHVQFHQDGNKLYDDFIIVHHKPESPLGNQNGCYIYNLNVQLNHCLGDNGKAYLLSLLDPGEYFTKPFQPMTSNVRAWVELFRRLQIPYYEEARQYWNQAMEDGFFGGFNESCMYEPETLKQLIKTYGN